MAAPRPYHAQPANRLDDLLPPGERDRLLAVVKPVPLALNEVVHQARKPVEYIYFPTTGVISSLTVMDDGKAIEVGNVGNEGMAPASAFMGSPSAPNQNIVQVGGEALRVEVDVLSRLAGRDGPLRRVLVQYLQYFQLQVSQSVG